MQDIVRTAQVNDQKTILVFYSTWGILGHVCKSWKHIKNGAQKFALILFYSGSSANGYKGPFTYTRVRRFPFCDLYILMWQFMSQISRQVHISIFSEEDMKR